MRARGKSASMAFLLFFVFAFSVGATPEVAQKSECDTVAMREDYTDNFFFARCTVEECSDQEPCEREEAEVKSPSSNSTYKVVYCSCDNAPGCCHLVVTEFGTIEKRGDCPSCPDSGFCNLDPDDFYIFHGALCGQI